jgi:hypothetical protein
VVDPVLAAGGLWLHLDLVLFRSPFTAVTDTQIGEITLPQVIQAAPGYETLLAAPHRVLNALRSSRLD